MNKTHDQDSSPASDFEFPCKPMLGPSPELMQSQPSLRIVQESIVWRQHIRRAHREAKMGGVWSGEAFLRPFSHRQCQLGTVPYTIQEIAVITVNHDPPKSYLRHDFVNYGTYSTKRTVLYTIQCTGLFIYSPGQS
jgi:hypothetical protein